MEHNEWTELVERGVKEIIHRIGEREIRQLAERIQDARRVFLMGSGRTGLITQAFGMRLAQLGLPVFIVGQPTTPALEKGDFLVLVSGSGRTETLLRSAQKAREVGAEIYLVTQNRESPLGEGVPEQLLIPSPVQDTKVLNGTLFELSLLITLDAVVNQLLELSGQSFEDLSERHANLG